MRSDDSSLSKRTTKAGTNNLSGFVQMSITHSERALERAIKLAGGQSKLARAIGYTQNSIWKAKNSGRISAELAIAIEAAMGGRVTKEQLAPEKFKKLPRQIAVMPHLAYLNADDESVA
jgi:DNA-binding transcriptional regulator YdaS (Cro superfamily)